jgi:hypothetical protein
VTLPLRYTLPASKVRSLGAGVFQYRLLMQKQPGLPTEPVSLLVQLPPGAELVRTTPPDSRQEGEWVRLDVDLSGDTTFAVDFRMR